MVNGTCADIIRARGALIGAALLAFGLIAFGAYSFAAGGDQPVPTAMHPVSTAEIRTTPDNTGSHEVPPPVAPAKAQ